MDSFEKNKKYIFVPLGIPIMKKETLLKNEEYEDEFQPGLKKLKFVPCNGKCYLRCHCTYNKKNNVLSIN
jgi:hypothetical protein